MTGLLVLAAFVGFWFLVRRANELCVFEVRNGNARLERGRAPARLLFDVTEIARRARIERATIRVVSESGAPSVRISGSVSDSARQQLRNVVGEHQVLHFRSGRHADR